jgi:hypothetical protein
LATVIHVGHNNATGLIEAEKDPPLAHTKTIPAFQGAFQRFHVAETGNSESFQARTTRSASERSMRLSSR